MKLGWYWKLGEVVISEGGEVFCLGEGRFLCLRDAHNTPGMAGRSISIPQWNSVNDLDPEEWK